ncbi:MAG: hypothetical protein IT360_08850 [Gemmatimonadaceae bacterium]|nr:hypothetical protein [Gemmatimonadaceae bacterium]
MSTRAFRQLLAPVLVALLAACSDKALSPTEVMTGTATSNPAVLAADFVDITQQFGWLPKIALTTVQKKDTVVQTFTLDPKAGGLVTFGSGHRLVIYPWAICDPKSSGYGPTTWLNNCIQATTAIKFTIRSFTTKAGRPGTSVMPNVRFAPGSLVRLYFHDAKLTTFGKVHIPWCNSAGVCVDEGKSDTWQQTYYAPGNPGYWVYRNLRHFSSYIVAY